MTNTNTFCEHIGFEDFCRKYNIILNSQQAAAVQAVNGATLLVAVPGSGKTTVLVARLGYMIICKNIPAENILAITYTTTAAADMQKRFASFFGTSLSKKIQFRTINSLCHEIIRHHLMYTRNQGFDIIEDNIKKEVIKKILIETSEEYPSENDIQEAETAITYIKNMALSTEQIKNHKTPIDNLYEIYEKYIRTLKCMKKMDYDDQMVYSSRILYNNPEILSYFRKKYTYICVDEAQDTSKLQHFIIKMLAMGNNNIFMVGDEDQSIYGFRAAYPQALINFKNDYHNANILFMEQNYRSTTEIIDTASKFIERNTDRYKKKLIATKGNGEIVSGINLSSRNLQYSFLVEKIRNVDSNTAVIYRDNDCAVPLVDLLLRKNIPFNAFKLNCNFFNHRIVSDIKAFFALAKNPYDTQAFMQIYYKCNLHMKKSTAEKICSTSRSLGISVLQAIKSNAYVSSKSAGQFEKFIFSIRKHSTYDALGLIENHLKSFSYNTLNGKMEILKILALREKNHDSFIQRLQLLPQLIQENTFCKNNNAVTLTTIHSSKGLEYDTVYIMDVFDGLLPQEIPNPQSTESELALYQEERRLFYVALTRARKKLYVISFTDRKCSFANEILPVTIRSENKSYVAFPYVSTDSSECKLLPNVSVSGKMYGVGNKVIHQIHGYGEITEISPIENCNDRHKIRIKYINGKTNTYELQTLLKNNMLKFIK